MLIILNGMSTQPDSPTPPADIRFRCPACNGKIVVDHTAVGFYASCPHCRERILIRRDMASAVPEKSSPPKQVRPNSPAAQPPAGIKPKTDRPAAPAAGSAPTPVRELLTTQKIPGAPVKPAVAPAPPPPAQKPDAAAAEASDLARQSLTSLIDGLKRENQELKKRLAGFNPATATMAGLMLEPTTSVPDAVAIANAELAKLREMIGKLETARTESESSVAELRRDLESARTSAAKSSARGDELAGQINTLETRLKQQTEIIAGLETSAREAAGLVEQLRLASARNEAAALTKTLDLVSARDEIARFQRELTATSRDRDIATADIALARQSLRELSRQLDAARSDHAAARKEAAAIASERDDLRGRLAAEQKQLDEAGATIRTLNDQLAQIPKPEDLKSLRDEADRANGQLASIRAELAGLRMSETAFRNHYAESSAELAGVRELAQRQQQDITTLQTRLAELQSQRNRLNEDNDRLLSEKSALALALDEAKERGQQLDAEKWRADELARKLESLTQEHEAVVEQLDAANKVAADMRASLKRIDELEGENNKLREQIKKTEHEIAMRASPHGLELVEARFRRRIEELESTLKTAGSVTQTLRARIADLEKDQRRQPLPDQDAARAHDEKIAALQKQLFEAESATRKAQGERDAALRAKVEAEAAVDALSGQARDLQDHLDALNKKIAETPAAPLLAEMPPPSPRKTKHGATHHGELKAEPVTPLEKITPSPTPAPETSSKPETASVIPTTRQNTSYALLAIILAIVLSFFGLWYFEIIVF